MEPTRRAWESKTPFKCEINAQFLLLHIEWPDFQARWCENWIGCIYLCLSIVYSFAHKGNKNLKLHQKITKTERGLRNSYKTRNVLNAVMTNCPITTRLATRRRFRVKSYQKIYQNQSSSHIKRKP